MGAHKASWFFIKAITGELTLMMIDSSRSAQGAGAPHPLIALSLPTPETKCDPGSSTLPEFRPGNASGSRRDTGVGRELKQIKDLMASFSSTIASLKDSLTQVLSLLKPASPTPTAPAASPVDASLNGNSQSGQAGSAVEGQPLTLKEKILKLVSDLVDLFAPSGTEGTSINLASKKEAEPVSSEKKGSLFGSVMDSVRNFGKSFLKKQGPEVVGKVIGMF